jgi:hypothetical protein
MGSKKHWTWAAFFAAGTFLGGYVLGFVGRVFGKVS